ncbi:hypothetical protein Tco_1022213, partial [Tanacetum coccineum]
MQLHKLMNLCTKLYDRVLALETKKTTQALEIASLKSRVKKLEKKASKRTHKFKRFYRVGTTRRVESSNDEGLGAQEDASKKERSIEDIDKDVEHDVIPKEVSATKILTTTGITIPVGTAEIVSTAEIKTSAAPSTTVVSPPFITKVEITLAQKLAELKSAKSKVVMQEPVQSTVTTAPSTILKAKGITFRDAGETTTRTPTLLARRLDAEEQEAARLERENEQEQGELTIEEKLKLFMELIKERKRHFAKLRAEEKRRKPLTKEDDKETNEHEEAEKDDEAEMKKHMEIVQDDEEIAIDSIPLATKPLMIVEYKIVKEGQKRFYHLIRADGSSN